MSPRSSYGSDNSIGGTVRRLSGSKTFWTAMAGLVTAVGAYLAGEIGMEQLITAVFAVLTVVFVRDAQGKAIEAAEDAKEEAGEAKEEAARARVLASRLDEEAGPQ